MRGVRVDVVCESDGCAGQEVRPAVQGSGRSEFAVAGGRGSVPRYSGVAFDGPAAVSRAGMMARWMLSFCDG